MAEAEFIPHVRTEEEEGKLIEKEEEIDEKPADMSTFYSLLKYTGGYKSFIIPTFLIAFQKGFNYYSSIEV